MKNKKLETPFEYEQQLIDWLIKYFDGLPHELKKQLADALATKLINVWMHESFANFMPEWSREFDDLRGREWR